MLNSLPSKTCDSSLLRPDGLARSLGELVRINSVNPAHGGPDGGEAKVVEWVARFLLNLGRKSTRQEVHPGRPNLSVMLPGRNTAKTLAFITHTDTVSAAQMTIDPFGGEIHGGRLWGRGSTDAKGQVVAMLHAFAATIRNSQPPPVNIQLTLTIDEEAGFSGVRGMIAGGLKIDGAVIGEPTQLQVVVAHKGTQRWWITVKGKSAHSAKPHLGVNAIHHASALIRKIQEDYAGGLSARRHDLLGFPSVNVSKIEGGTQVNLVPALTRILIDRRGLPGETRESVHAEFENIFREVKREFPDFDAVQESPLMVDPPLSVELGHPLVTTARRIAELSGRDSAPQGVPYGTDGSKLSEIGIPTIVVGPGSIDQAHTADEFIELDELAAGARFYYDLMNAPPW